MKIFTTIPSLPPVVRSFPILLISLLTSLSTPGFGQDLEKKVDEYLNAHLAQGTFSGSILIARENKILVTKGYGMANAATGTPNTAATRHQLASITKQFTGALILLLQEQGKLRVTDPLSKYLYGFPKGDQITIHHLLTHTSGVPAYAGFTNFQETVSTPLPLPQLMERFKQTTLDFDPGSQFNYSNSGYVLLGHIIEKVTGKPYPEALQEYILAPLEMTGTGYEPTTHSPEKTAIGYRKIDGNYEVASTIDISNLQAAGGMYSTVLDLFTWEQALREGKFLRPESLKQLFIPYRNNYGYGWKIDSAFQQKRIWHSGSINGVRTISMRFPEKDVFIAVLGNTETIPDRVFRDISAMALGQPYELPKERAKVPQALLDQYVGAYELRPGLVFNFTTDNGLLFVQATGKPAIEAIPESDSKFFVREVDAKFTFERNEEGKVTHAVLHQRGDHILKKIR